MRHGSIDKHLARELANHFQSMTPQPKEPEQKPVAWSYWQSCLNDDGTQTAPWVHRLSKFKPTESIINKDVTPLYTTQPQRKPLTREVIDRDFYGRVDFVRQVEAAHGIGDKK